MKASKTIILVRGKEMHVIIGTNNHKLSPMEHLWDFPFEEILDGTIDFDDSYWYVYDNGRLYETENKVK